MSKRPKRAGPTGGFQNSYGYGDFDYWRSGEHEPDYIDQSYACELLERTRSAEQWREHQRRRRQGVRYRRKLREEKEQNALIQSSNRLVTQMSTEVTLRGLDSFEAIIGAESQLQSSSANSPQAAQLLAMIPGCRDICALVGMTDAKKQLFDLVMCGLLDRLVPTGTMKRGLQNLVILGPPGVGKTSLLLAFAEICKAGGITRRSHVSFVGRSDMVGQYLGSSAKNTTQVVQDALGGLLVLDEIYSFGSPENRDSFAKEAIDTLNHLMDLHKGDLLVAVAGYPDDVRNCFFAQNKGLERRFLVWITLPSYTTAQLADILENNCKKLGWTLAPGAREKMVDRAAELTHNAADIVALITQLEISSAHRRWARAAPLCLPRIVNVKEATSCVLPLPPLVQPTCISPLCGQNAVPGRVKTSSPYQFGSVDPSSLAMEVTAPELEKAIQRVLQERSRVRIADPIPLGMYL